jgi:hypothetical protein
MAKEALKLKINQNLKPTELRLVDVHRKVQKKDGGKYDDDNYTIIDPIEHMKEHGTYREREKNLENLKMIFDDRQQMINLRNKVSNQLDAYNRRTDQKSESMVEWLEMQLDHFNEQLKLETKKLEKEIKNLSKTETNEGKLVKCCLDVPSVGFVTIAACLVYIDIEKARHASSLWSYSGLDKSSHERYTKGVSGGGNKTLRCILYNLATSQMKNKNSAYRKVYDDTKKRLEKSDKIVKSRNTQGKLVEIPWKETKPSHRHGAALRKIMKHFLADYWYVARTIYGFETDALYPEAILGGNHRTIMPEERGWNYK